MTQVDHDYYTGTYLGSSIPEAEFPTLARRAGEELERMKRIYTVTGEESAEKDAICAMADALYWYDGAANSQLVTSVSVGSVSTGMSGSALPDTSQVAQAKELYRCACRYLDIFRGIC